MMTLDPSFDLTQFARDGDSFVPTTSDVGVSERPPMVDVAEYQTRLSGIRG
jgi:hypothetical protein